MIPRKEGRFSGQGGGCDGPSRCKNGAGGFAAYCSMQQAESGKSVVDSGALPCNAGTAMEWLLGTGQDRQIHSKGYNSFPERNCEQAGAGAARIRFWHPLFLGTAPAAPGRQQAGGCLSGKNEERTKARADQGAAGPDRSLPCFLRASRAAEEIEENCALFWQRKRRSVALSRGTCPRYSR